MAVVSPRSLSRRLAALLIVLALVGAPALVLRLFCVGRSCNDRQAAAAEVPFCPLPSDVRTSIAAGFRSGRSPDVMATTAGTAVVEPPGPGGGSRWPSDSSPDLRVPIAFLGPSVTRGSLPDGMGIDQIAPTIARSLGYERSHPEVRAGTAVPLTDAATPGAIPLVVEIAWLGVGTSDLGSTWPSHTARVVRGQGVTTLNGDAGSLPLDPAATLTTMGTGGLPFQHGVTGSVIRSDTGGAVAAWADDAPTSVISTLPDDLRHSFGDRSRVGLVAPRRTDRGLVGSGWYLGASPGRMILGSGDPLPAVTRLLDGGFGATDGAPDVLGVVVHGAVGSMDRETEALVATVRARVPGSLIVLAGTGSRTTRDAAALPLGARKVAGDVDAALGEAVVAGTVAGGLFLDPKAMDAAHLTADAVVRQMAALPTPAGGPVFSQAFPSFSVAFARFC